MTFIIYTETLPREAQDARSGLDILLEPICRGLEKSFKSIIFYNVYAERLTRVPKFFTNKFIQIDSNTIDSTFKRIIPKPSRKERRELSNKKIKNIFTGEDELLVIVGADIRIVCRAVELASNSGRPYSIYFIDDPFASLSDKKLGMVRQYLWRATYRKFVMQAKMIYSFTSNHSKVIAEEYGVPCVELPLPYYSMSSENQIVVSGSKKKITNENQIFLYMGSINYLYRDNILNVIKILENINREKKYILKLQLTNAIECQPNDNYFVGRIRASEMTECISNAMACIVTYSFSEKNKKIIENTFPSKLFQYIPHARNIIYYGPDYSVLANLAKTSEGYILHVKNEDELEMCLRELQIGVEGNESSLDFIDNFTHKYSIHNFSEIINKNIDRNISRK